MRTSLLHISRGLLSIAVVTSVTLGQAQAQQLQAGDIIPGEVIVSVSEIAPLSKRDLAQFEAVTGKDLAPVDKDSHAVLLADPAATEDSEPLCNRYHRKLRGFKAQLKKVGSHRTLPLVKCSPNIVVAATALPNDPSFTSLWGMNQSNNVDINAPEAWDQSTGSSSVVVAVIDSGVDYNHPDLAANMWTNPNEIPGNGIDDDGNGYIDDIHGINAITNSGNPMDDFGHGTHVSGTIAGVGNNGVGVTGVSWRSKIIGVKFLASNGYGSLMDSIKALDYVSALKNSGVNIVATSNSWGYAGGSYQPLEDAIARSKNAGILFIAAAGNNSANCDTTGFYPGNSPQSNVISVAAVDQSGNLASFSNYGAMNVDLGAPGVHIASTYPQNQYVWMDGTSMATPHVSGAAALIKSAYPNLTWQQIKDAILGSVSPLSSLSGKTSTGGMLNLQNAFAQLGPVPPVVPTVVPSPTPTPTATLTPTPVNTPTPTMTPTITPTPGIYTVSGEVRTADGIIVTGARVELTTTTGQSYVVTTGAGGRFNFAAMRGGSGYTIVVTRVGYSFNPQTGSLWSDATHDFVALQNSYNINMKAISARDGTVIPSGMSFAISINGGSPQPLTQNSYGVATLGAAYGTRYTITASGPGYTCDSILNAEVWGDVTRVLGCSLN